MGFRRSLVRIQSPRHDGGAEVTRSYDGPSSFSPWRKTRLVSIAVRNPRPSLTNPDGLPCLKRAEGRLANANPTQPFPRQVHLGRRFPFAGGRTHASSPQALPLA